MALESPPVDRAVDLPAGRGAAVEHPAAPRPYLEITPAETPVDPRAATTAMDLLEAVLRDARGHRLRSLLTQRSADPVVEVLLVADGRPDPTVRHLVGADPPALLDELADALRTGLPDGYVLTPVRWHPRYAEEFLAPLADGLTEPYVAAVSYRGRVSRANDWQTPLAHLEAFADRPRSTRDTTAARRVPLATLVDVLADADRPTLVQVVARPHRDWTRQAQRYTSHLAAGQSGFRSRLGAVLFTGLRDGKNRSQPPPDDRARLEGIATRDPARTLVVSARAVVLAREDPDRADDLARRLRSVLAPLGGRHHAVIGVVETDAGRLPRGTLVYEDFVGRRVHVPSYGRLLAGLLGRNHDSRGIVVGADELAGFCVVDGGGLTPIGRRAIAARPAERTGLPLPPPADLAHYRPPGMVLGMPLTHDRHDYGRPLVLPPGEQDRHVIVVGPTGAGKSVLTETAMLTNLAATDGPAILLDYKGGGTSREYLQAHYRTHGTLEDVTYIDCERTLPALSVLDLRPLLDAGVPREEARSRLVGHYEEILEGVMGAERYWRAVESPKVIRNHLRALFDPVNGTDAIAHRELFEALRRTLVDDMPPPVSESRLDGYFVSLLDRDRDVRNRVLGGALNRVETIATDGRLAPVFDHVPEADDPHLDFADVIDEDRVIIIDFGGMEAAAKRPLTLALLSNLWRALRARATDPTRDGEAPLVNLYLEEAGSLADSALLDTLLSQGRSFGLSVFLGVQFLGQLDGPDPERHTAAEAVNETATILTGRVAVRDDLVDALASEVLPPRELNRRLSRLPRGEWLVRPASPFGAEAIRPFLCRSLAAPPGHPASPEPLSAADLGSFDDALDALVDRSRTDHGVAVTEADLDDGATRPRHPSSPDHCYAHSRRFPASVVYRPAAAAVVCARCENRYNADIHGLQRAIACHGSLDDVDRDDLPIGDLTIKLSVTERAARKHSAAQLRFLQAVYDAMQERFHPLEYDLTRDSMLLLLEYVDIRMEEVQRLVDDGLLTVDRDRPYRLYTVTPAGRKAIGEAYREGVDFGHGRGDLTESTSHILGVILAERFVGQEYRGNPDSEVVQTNRYHELGDGQRLDVAGLDAAGDVIVAVEVECVNHDVRRAAPDDFDKLASCEPKEALWVAMSQREAHDILAALNDPLDGRPRVEKTYRPGTPVRNLAIDTPGCTGFTTVARLQSKPGIE